MITKGFLQRRSIYAIGAFLALLILANTAVSLHALRQGAIDSARDKLANTTFIISENVSNVLSTADSALNLVVNVVKEASPQSDRAYQRFVSQEKIFELITSLKKANDMIDVISYVGGDGTVHNFSRSYPVQGINLANRDYFKYLSQNDTAETFFSAPVQNKGNGKWVFYAAKRINNQRHEFLGIALVGISIEVFSKSFEQIAQDLGRTASIALFQSNYRLVARWPFVESQIGLVNTGNLIKVSLDNAGIHQGVIITDEPAYYGGQNPNSRMASFRVVPGYPFIVGAVVPQEVYMQGFHDRLWEVVYTNIFSLVIFGLLILGLLRLHRSNELNFARSLRDPLTGLPNRILVSDRVQQYIASAKRNSESFAAIFVDLDNFKKINDQYSHSIGDEVLKQVATRLKQSIRASDTVGRIGGDEFVMLIYGVTSVDEARSVCEKIKTILSEEMEIDGLRLIVQASFGIAIYPQHGENEFDLMKNADIAMYEIKRSGRNGIEVSVNKG